MMKRVFLYLFLVLLLAACGGGGNEPAPNNSGADAGANNGADANAANDAAEPAEEEPVADEAAEPTAEEESADENASTGEEATPTEEPAAEESGDAAASAGDGEGVYFGIDPETGLEINPQPIPFGVEFIARGEVIGMNLTPQDKPEFVIRSPAGQTYRIATQALDQIFLIDGSQLKPFEYRLKMEAKATAYFPPDASLSDVLTSTDFTIISLPE